MKKYAKLLLFVIVIHAAGVPLIYCHVKITRDMPISTNVWPFSTGPLSKNSSLELADQAEISIVYGSDNEHTLILDKTNLTKEICWQVQLIKSCCPVSYFLAYDGASTLCIHIWLDNMTCDNAAGINNAELRLTIFPDSILSKILYLDKLTLDKFDNSKIRVCTMFIDSTGNVLETILNSSLFRESSEVPFVIAEKNDVRTTFTQSQTEYFDEPPWDTIQGDGVKIVLSVTNNHNKNILIAQITDAIIYQGELILKVPKKTQIFQYYLAIITFDEYGNIIWKSLAGPFTNGSVGLTSAHANNNGHVFLVATYKDEVEYWKDNRGIGAISPRRHKIYNAYHGLNHGQALLVIDHTGELIFSGILADGYLYAPSILCILPDQSLGLYVRVGPRAQLVNNNRRVNYPASPPYIFVEVSNAYWSK